MSNFRCIALSLGAAVAIPMTVWADDTAQTATKQSTSTGEAQQAAPAAKPIRLDKKQTQELSGLLELKRAESTALSLKSAETTKKIGDLVASGRVQSDPDATAELKRMVDELEEIRIQLQKVTDDIAEIKGWIEGQQESLPVLIGDVETLKKARWSGYIQAQYRWSDQLGQNRGFSLRRTRLTFDYTIDSKTRARASFDTAASQFGSAVNEPIGTTVQMRDAYVAYSPIISDVQDGITVRFGQFSPLIGHEISRSSSEREFPERAEYNTRLFPGERVRGVDANIGLGKDWSAQIGLFNSLAFNDNEQRTVTGPPLDRMAGLVGLKYNSKTWDFGFGAFIGKRSQVRVGRDGNTNTDVFAPEVDRKFFYADFSAVGLFHPNFLLRGEAMWGEDRLGQSPYTSSSAGGITNPNDARLDSDKMRGWYIQPGWNIDSRNQIFAKWQFFDPNTDNDGDSFSGFGLSYLYYLNPSVRFMVSWEEFDNQALSGQTNKYKVITLRSQFRF